MGFHIMVDDFLLTVPDKRKSLGTLTWKVQNVCQEFALVQNQLLVIAREIGNLIPKT